MTDETKTDLDEPAVRKFAPTPNGVRPQDRILILKPNEDVVQSNGSVGAIHRKSKKKRFLHNDTNELAQYASNWITYASWSNGQPISSFRASWRVPSAPHQVDGQVIFLFIGLQDAAGTQIVQPVLQWGKTDYGGGNGWFVGSWLAGHNGQAAVTPMTPVAPDTQLFAEIDYTRPGPNNTFCYKTGFSGFNQSGLSAAGIESRLTEVSIVLESYGVQFPGDYPPEQLTSFGSIAVAINGALATPAWQKTDRIKDFNVHTNLHGPGAVDICYR